MAQMHDFDALVDEVLRNRPEVTKDSLMGMLQEKKRTVGSGYLTDQGALFLVAGELGVRLQHMVTTDLAVKDIHLGANDITVVASVLAIYPVSEFDKKDGSGKGRYRRVVLFDRGGTCRLTIWEDNEEAMALRGVSVGTAVRVVSAYVKPGYLDGKPTLNLGKRGRIEMVADSTAGAVAKLSSLAREPSSVVEGETVAVVGGVAASEGRRSTFTRRDDNSTGSLTQFDMKGPDGKAVRTVIWDAGDLPGFDLGARLLVTNLRGKKGRQGDVELHGDAGSVVILMEDESNGEREEVFVKVADVAKRTPADMVSLEVMALSNGSVREVSLKDRSTAKKGEVVLGDDTGEITIVSWRESASQLEGIKTGDRLRLLRALVQVSKAGTITLELGPTSVLERLQGKV